MDLGTWGCVHEPTNGCDECSPSDASASAAVWEFAEHTATDCNHSGADDRDPTGEPASGLRAGIRSVDCVWIPSRRLPRLVFVSRTLYWKPRDPVWHWLCSWLL